MWAAEAGPQPAALPVGAAAWPGGGIKETAGPVETKTQKWVWTTKDTFLSYIKDCTLQVRIVQDKSASGVHLCPLLSVYQQLGPQTESDVASPLPTKLKFGH